MTRPTPTLPRPGKIKVTGIIGQPGLPSHHEFTISDASAVPLAAYLVNAVERMGRSIINSFRQAAGRRPLNEIEERAKGSSYWSRRWRFINRRKTCPRSTTRRRRR